MDGCCNYKAGKKHFLLFIFRLFLLLQCLNIASQTDPLAQKVTLHIESTKYEALKALEDNTGYFFSYKSDLFNTRQSVTVNVTDESLKNAIRAIVPDTTLKLKCVGNQIVLFKPLYIHSSSEGKDIIQKELIKISGHVLDGSKEKPIAYASLAIANLYRGTVTNGEGEFQLTLSVDELDDTLAVSCLGYKPQFIPLTKFLTQPQTIILEDEYISIPEVVIRRINPEYLIVNAIKKIPENYSDIPVNFTGFYRESIQKRKDFVAVSEAIVEGYKPSYTREVVADQIKIIKSRKCIDKQYQDSILFKIKAGLKTVLLLDIVKNHPDFIVPKDMSTYRYSIQDIMVKGSDDVYVVYFNHRDQNEDAHYKGKLYINDANLAILNCEFSLNKFGLAQAGSYMIVKKPRSYKVKPVQAHYEVHYNQLNNNYHLGYIRSVVTFSIRHKREVFKSVYTMTTEMVVNQIDTSHVSRFSSKEIAKSKEIFQDIVESYDDIFWEQYDFIPPERSLIEAIGSFSNNSNK